MEQLYRQCYACKEYFTLDILDHSGEIIPGIKTGFTVIPPIDESLFNYEIEIV